MTNHLSIRAVVLVGLLAVTLPVVSRLAQSPLLLLLLSPLIFLVSALAFLGFTIFLGHFLDSKRQRGPGNVYQFARPFAFSTPAAWQAVLTRSQWSHNTTQPLPPLYPESPEISAALNDILDKVIRDFVWAWYDDISSNPSFPAAVSTLLHASLAQLLRRVSNVDLATLIVRRILPIITAHIDQFRQSEMALRGAGLERKLTQSEELDLLLASRYAGKGATKLHPAIDNLSTTFTKQNEEMHLRQLLDRVLPFLLPEPEAHSTALKIVAREITTCTVLYPVMDLITDPDFWNRMIDQVAGAAIHQQKLITKVRSILEAQSPIPLGRHPPTQLPPPPTSENITIRTDVRQFESFLRSINLCSSLLDARRLKNDIMGEIRRTRMLLANHEKDDWINGEKTEDVVAFLDRLYTAKRKVEDRIVLLGGGDGSKQPTLHDAESKHGVSLRDVLRNPSSLSYFMEFMDRRHRSLPVQFWLTVESFKNPLETVDSDSSGSEDDLQDLFISPTLKEDISMIHELYFSGSDVAPALSTISRKHVDIIREFVRNHTDPSQAAQRRVRRSVLLAQRQIEKDMEHDFEEFERSDLWFRVLNDTDFSATETRDNNRLSMISSQSLPSANSEQLPLPRIISDGPSTTLNTTFTLPRTASSGSGRSLKPTNNIGVLMSPISETGAEPSRAPLFNEPEDEIQREEEKRMEAIHVALTDMMALENEESGPSLFGDEAIDVEGSFKTSSIPTKGKRRAVFDDVEDEEHDEGDENGLENSITGEAPSYRPAGPGDLQLSYEIERLGDKITQLETQEAMLDNLIRKAELTGDTQELKLLNKSKSSMSRELRELQFQKAQYEQQENANRLISDRTKVSIVSSTVSEENGKSVVRYLVEVQQLAADGSFASGWVVARRYNEFFNMHNRLREKYALVKNLDFPGKSLVTTLSGSFVDMRKVALEKYLQNLIAIPIVCESIELRTFLSRDSPFVAGNPDSLSKPVSRANLVKNVYRHVAESIDDMFFGPSMLDVLIQDLTRQAAEFAGIVGSGINDEDLVAQALNASKATAEATLMRISGELKLLEGEAPAFTAPICDLILTMFELNKKNNWLRRQATLIILQQVLGGTIERKIRETVQGLMEESKVLGYLDLLRESLWPGGKLKGQVPPRTAEEKLRTRDEANRKLSSLVPDLAANMIGRTNARRGARRIFAVLQNRRLNQHIAYTIVDEVCAALFPESNITTTS